MGRDLLEGLSPSQIEAVTTAAAPLAIIAGPGSGKTRVLTHRIGWRVTETDADPARVLALTFSRRAASELYGRLRRLGLPAGGEAGVTAGTFHAVAWAELSRFRADRGRPPVSVIARPVRLVTPALARVLGRQPSSADVAAVLREIAWARVSGIRQDDYVNASRRRRRSPVPPDAIVDTWVLYQRAKRERQVLDLDDLLEECASLLETDAGARDAARWRHRHVFVDEYQDLNPAHHRLLRAWVSGRPDLCVVGDPDQAVYGFNGATPDLFDRVVADWPGIDILRLTDNHRSTPEVVRLAEAIRPGAGSVPFRSLRPPGPVPRLVADADDRREAERVAAELSAHHAPGGAWSGMAVLARTNARLRVIGNALDQAGVPWRLRDPRPLADRPIIKGWLGTLPPEAPVRDFRELVDQREGPNAEADATAVLAALAEFETDARAATVSGFATWLDATGVSADEAPAWGVDLATFHRAKGLEWPAVWIVGVEEGLVPISGGAEVLAEEQRLLYVAVSRAEDSLTISWSGPRPSRWVAALESARAEMGARPPAPVQRARLSALRQDLAPSAAATRRVALSVWRDHRARAARIPAAAVLSDRILDDLAGADIRTETDVVRVAAAAGRRAELWAAEVLSVLEAAR